MNLAAINYSTLKSCLLKGISFAAYSLPGETKFSFIAQYDQAIELEDVDYLAQGFIIHPFDAEAKHPILFIKNDFSQKEGDVNKNVYEFIQSIKEYSKPIYSEIAGNSKKDYFNLFNQFKQVLDEGGFEKLVLSRIKNIQIGNSFDIVDLFENLNHKYLDAFNHLFFTPQSGVWIGASPEIFFSMDNKIAKTVALAGTQKKNDSSNYIWKEKEIEEQKFVIDYIQQILENQISKSAIKIKNKCVEAGKMVHLKTNFSFPSKDIKNISDLINQLHPTPAVCGLPKKKAKQFITQNEGHDRAYYSGFMGPLNMNQETHLFVNLRCLKMKGKTLSLFLGGGLTKNSIAKKEWEETELKATTLESLL